MWPHWASALLVFLSDTRKVMCDLLTPTPLFLFFQLHSSLTALSCVRCCRVSSPSCYCLTVALFNKPSSTAPTTPSVFVSVHSPPVVATSLPFVMSQGADVESSWKNQVKVEDSDLTASKLCLLIVAVKEICRRRRHRRLLLVASCSWHTGE